MILLLTGCINPDGMKYTALQNAKERELQYYNAIQYYLDKTSLPIVFCENSNQLEFCKYFKAEKQKGKFEYLTFNGNNYDKNRGKGYGEAIIIDYALKHSKIINQNSVDNSIVKITGRIIIKNINVLLSHCNKDKVYANFYPKDKLCSSQCFVSPISFLSFFVIDAHRINDSKHYYFEHLLYDKINDWKKMGRKHSCFINPILRIGISGTTGQSLSNAKCPHIRSFIRYCLYEVGILRMRNVN